MKGTSQTTYSSDIVGEIRDMFGTECVEYGLVQSGSLDLARHLKTQHLRNFSVDAILKVSEGTEDAEGIVQNARDQRKIQDLIVKIESGGRRSMPTWFEPVKPTI